MRGAGFVDREGRVHDWWLYDGARSRRVGRLTEEMAELSLFEIWNDTLLFERVASGWSPSDDRRLVG
jgi:hypothetical protein